MENLNAEQIIKALECCTRGIKSNEDRPCLECPYNECNLVGGTSERQIKGTCQGWLMKDALALITSQEQRIKELTEENERLNAQIKEGIELAKQIPEMINETARATVKKMQEKLMQKILEITVGNDSFAYFLKGYIDQTAKEMLEGE